MMREYTGRLILPSIAAIFLGLISVNTNSQPRPVYDTTLQLGEPATPISVESYVDGHILVAAQTARATVLKLKPNSTIEWRFDEEYTAGAVRVNMATPLRDGGAIICGTRRSPAPGFNLLSGFVILLDKLGREVHRLDSAKSDFAGKKIYSAMTCAPWLNGFAITGTEAIADEKTGTVFDPYSNGRSAVYRLNADLTVAWTKAVPVGGVEAPTLPSPREMVDGRLVVPSGQGLYIFEADGKFIPVDPSFDARWVRSSPSDIHMIFVDSATPRILLLDAKAKEQSVLKLAGTSGSPLIARNSLGRFIVVMNGRNSGGPEASEFDAAGKLVGNYTFSNGRVQDITLDPATGNAIILRAVSQDEHFSINISRVSF